MSHFGSGDWNNPSGLVAQLSKTSVTAATGTSSTEGTDKLTYAVKRTGLYMVCAVIGVRTTGTGASQAVVPQIAYTNNSAAVTAGDIVFPGVTATKADLTSATGRAAVIGIYQCLTGTNIVVTVSGSGTFTSAGIYDLDVEIVAL